MRVRLLSLSFAVMMLICCGIPRGTTAQCRTHDYSWSADESDLGRSAVSGFPDRRWVAESKEEKDHILYSAGPADDAVQELRSMEEDKQERSWEMLRNMIIIIEDDRRSHLPRNPSHHPPMRPR